MTAIHVSVEEVLIKFLCLLVLALLKQFLVVEVHIWHVVHARVLCESQFRVFLCECGQLVGHREDAAYHYRTLCVDVCLSLKHFRKAVIHSLGYLLVLQRTEWRQLAKAVVCLGVHLLYALHHVAPRGRQHPCAVSLAQAAEWEGVVLRVYQIA